MRGGADCGFEIVGASREINHAFAIKLARRRIVAPGSEQAVGKRLGELAGFLQDDHKFIGGHFNRWLRGYVFSDGSPRGNPSHAAFHPTQYYAIDRHESMESVK